MKRWPIPPPSAAIALLLFFISAISLSAQTNTYKVLIFSKTAAFRHDGAIAVGVPMIEMLGTNNHFSIDATEDASVFTETNLAQYKAVVFLCTTGDVLDNNQQTAFEHFIQAGNGYVGIHSASDTEYEWPWYGELVGAYFLTHPSIQQATIKVADTVHPSTASLPRLWVRSDEWYDFQSNPRGNVHVLATVDENSYEYGGGSTGYDHPITWCHNYDGGRAWYTALGHTDESYSEPLFQAHILGGIEWAAGAKKGDAGATIYTNFQVQTLDSNLNEPMELSVAPDGRVFYIERDGALKIYRPQTSTSVLAGQLSVFNALEDGLLGITLDPGFVTNQWLYLMYSPNGTNRL